jgi:N-acyl amino acid synthase of PEP-CTERM/exosortase system
VLRNRRTGGIAGGVRLVLADPDDVTRPFPTEVAAAHYFDPKKINSAKLPRRRTAEISRLIIPKSVPAGGSTQQHRPAAFPFPVLGLLAGVIRLSSEQGVTHIYALMEPLLNRLLRRFSLHFDPVAPVIDYHGMRQAHLSILADVMVRTFRERKEVWDLLTDRGRFLPPGHPAVPLVEDQLPLRQIS